MAEDDGFPRGFDEHRRAQARRWANETTAEQRLEWLEQALKFAYACGIDVVAVRRKAKEQQYSQKKN
ncbi:MAG: hypothetical protein JSS72_04905 [Armatimonadetes bacterium]|nr:hypothetical protein [Armatimonadota bacterium]